MRLADRADPAVLDQPRCGCRRTAARCTTTRWSSRMTRPPQPVSIAAVRRRHARRRRCLGDARPVGSWGRLSRRPARRGRAGAPHRARGRRSPHPIAGPALTATAAATATSASTPAAPAGRRAGSTASSPSTTRRGVLACEAGVHARRHHRRSRCRAAGSCRSRRARSSSRVGGADRQRRARQEPPPRRHASATTSSRSSCCAPTAARIDCGPDEKPELVRATIGGLGLTGLIIGASCACGASPGRGSNARRMPFESLDEFFALSRRIERRTGNTRCRGSIAAPARRRAARLFFAATMRALDRAGAAAVASRRVPFTPPFSLVNAAVAARLQRALLPARTSAAREPARRALRRRSSTRSTACGTGTASTARAASSSTSAWCRAAPSSGATRELLRRSRVAGRGSFLAVLKTFGDRAAGRHAELSHGRHDARARLPEPRRRDARAVRAPRCAIVDTAGGRALPGQGRAHAGGARSGAAIRELAGASRLSRSRHLVADGTSPGRPTGDGVTAAAEPIARS